MNNMTKILRLFFLKMVLFLSVLEAATVDDDLSSARLGRASILNAGGKPVSFIIKSNLTPILSGQEKTEVYPTEGHKFYIYDADRSVSVELPSLIINNTKKGTAYLALAQERSYHLKPGETLDYTLGTFSYITGISLLGAEPSSTISWGANGDKLDVTLCAALESKPANTTFVTTPKDIERHERLYRKYFMPDSKERGRRVWDDFLAQGSGVTGVKRKEEVIISLTSYPARFETTWLAIESLLRQEEKPDRIVLNLFEGEFPGRVLPWFIRKQMERGLEINWCPENLKVYLKIIPTIQKFPEATLITVDDDRYYNTDLVKTFLVQHVAHPGEIISPTARAYVFKEEGRFSRIDYLAQNLRYDTAGFGIFEGFSGVLYPPHALHSEVLNSDNFKRFAPCADDVWLQAMAALQGTQSRGLPKELHERFCWPIEFEGTQETGLFHEHLYGNDWMAYHTLKHYGLLERVKLPEIHSPHCRVCRRAIDVPVPLSVPDSGTSAGSITLTTKGKKCAVCFKESPQKVLCIGCYDFGNIGDQIYKQILRHYLSTDYDVYFVPDTVRISVEGRYMNMESDQDDLEFDKLVIGGGGILKDFSSKCSIRYYIEKARDYEKPYFIVSAGLQTKTVRPSGEDTKTLLGSALPLLRDASALFVRSQADYYLLRSLLGDDISHKLIALPDLGYLYPRVLAESGIEIPQIKRYITLIQTGSATVNNSYIVRKIRDKQKEFPEAKLIVMNWGGIEDPSQAKDFKEWDLFARDAKHVFPEATVYMGDSISKELKAFHSHTTRISDLTPQKAALIVAQSHYVISGRYHGEVLARAFGVPFEPAIFSYKTVAERESFWDITTAFKQIEFLKASMSNRGITTISPPSRWTEDERNKVITLIHELNKDFDISFLQAMDNTTLYGLSSHLRKVS